MAVERPLRARLQLAITGAVLLFGGLNVLVVGRLSYRALEAEQDRRLAFAARLLAQRAAGPVLIEDYLDLQKLVEESRTLDPDLAYIVVLDRRGERVARSVSAGTLAGLSAPRPAYVAERPFFREKAEPILGGRLGEVRVGADEAALRAELGRIVGIVAAMVLAFLAVGVAAATVVARSVTRPLESLAVFAATFPLEGPLPKLSTDGRDEIAEVGRHLTASAAQLQRLHADAKAHEREMARVEHLATVGMLAAGVAHEINNPLAGIRTAMERLLRQSRDPDVAQRYGDVLRDAISRIERAVRGALTFARASEVSLESVSLPGAVERALELAGPCLEKGRIGLVREFEPSLPEVHADPAKLTQIVLNLVLNACDATPEGGEIAISARRGESDVTLDVLDSGPGVPSELREKVFNPFFTTKPVGEGTGLGLAVSRAAAREMGGDLALLPSAGAGAQFRLRLPQSREERRGTDPAR